MKSLMKSLSVWCWCLCMITFVFAEKEVKSQQELINSAIELMNSTDTPSAEDSKIEQITQQKAQEALINEQKRQAHLERMRSKSNENSIDNSNLQTSDFKYKPISRIKENSPMSDYDIEKLKAIKAKREAAANFRPELSSRFTIAPNDPNRERAADFSAQICDLGGWPQENFWILLDTQNYWAWGAEGYTQMSVGEYECETWEVLDLPAGNYIFILGDSFGDGGAGAEVFIDGNSIGGTATSNTDGLSPYSGLYESVPVSFTVESLIDPTCDDGMMNGDETGVDCGGSCEAACSTYSANFTIDGLEDCMFAAITGPGGGGGWDGFGTPLCEDALGVSCDDVATATLEGLSDGLYDFQISCVPEGTEGEWWNPFDWAPNAFTVTEGDCWNGNGEYPNYQYAIAGADADVTLCAGSCEAACADPEPTCDGVTVNLFDSFGDGWNGNVLTIGEETYTVDNGMSSAEFCYTGSMDVVVTGVDSGDYPQECSWSLVGSDGTELLAGGIPSAGQCLGTCTSGCTDMEATNYDAAAQLDDGSCEYAACDGVIVNLFDSWGDGWGSNSLVIGDQTYTFDDGAVFQECYTGPMDVVVTFVAGDWYGECSFSLVSSDGTELLAGEGLTFINGCLGTCTYGCTDMEATNYDATAQLDDGSCEYPACDGITVNLFDSYGDGWLNETSLGSIGDQTLH